MQRFPSREHNGNDFYNCLGPDCKILHLTVFRSLSRHCCRCNNGGAGACCFQSATGRTATPSSHNLPIPRRCREEEEHAMLPVLAALLMPRSTSMEEISAGPFTPWPLSSAKLAAVHPAPGQEDDNKHDEYEYDHNNVDWAAGLTMWGWESRHAGKKRYCCHCLDPPSPLPPTLPTSTFPGGRRCLRMMQSTRDTGNLRILRRLVAIRWRRGQLQTTTSTALSWPRGGS